MTKHQRFLLPAEYVVFDLETTGFDRLNDRIIEILPARPLRFFIHS